MCRQKGRGVKRWGREDGGRNGKGKREGKVCYRTFAQCPVSAGHCCGPSLDVCHIFIHVTVVMVSETNMFNIIH